MTKANPIITFSKKELRDHVYNNTVSYGFYELQPELNLFICATKMGIIRAAFLSPSDHQIIGEILSNYPLKKAYDAQELKKFIATNPALILAGTPFQINVWKALMHIPAGTTTHYQAIAHSIFFPKAYRAVANANGSNPIAYFIPCHRVIKKDGSLCGYNWGVEKKRLLLKLENQLN